MTPAARTDAAIGLLEQILSSPQAPADRIVAGWFRERRYAGAKDRAYIANLVWTVLRRRAELEWALADGALSVRTLVMAALVCHEVLPAADVAARFVGGEHAPGALSDAEQQTLAALRTDSSGAPDWVQANIRPDLEEALRDTFGDDLVPELKALAERAPVDLRVNTLRGDRTAAIAALAAEGIAAQPTPLSPVGLRLDARANVAGSNAFRDGLIEVQDEGSQLVALLVGAEPGETVVDWRAGGGGKTLALAAAMENRGRLIALDASSERLEAAHHRIARAGATIVETYAVGARPAVVADRVLVDAPCSGSGAWRRNPATKWTTTPEMVEEYAARQRAILDEAAAAVRPGGRLVYATCSLFRAENHAQVDAFLAAHRDFRLGSVSTAWQETIGAESPTAMPLLLLTPAENQTDGFFVAVLERRS